MSRIVAFRDYKYDLCRRHYITQQSSHSGVSITRVYSLAKLYTMFGQFYCTRMVLCTSFLLLSLPLLIAGQSDDKLANFGDVIPVLGQVRTKHDGRHNFSPLTNYQIDGPH